MISGDWGMGPSESEELRWRPSRTKSLKEEPESLRILPASLPLSASGSVVRIRTEESGKHDRRCNSYHKSPRSA